MKFFINFFSKLGVDTFSKAISVVTLPIITRGLGPEGYGEFIFITIVSAYFGIFIDFGYFLYATNQMSKFPEQSVSIVNKVLSIRFITALFSYFLVLLSFIFFNISVYAFIVCYSIIYFFQIFKIDFYYISNNKLYYNSFTELAGQIIFLTGILTVFTFYSNIWILIILTLIQLLTVSILSIYPFLKKSKIKLDFNYFEAFEIFKKSYKLGIAQKFEFITGSSVILLIGFLLSNESVGLFASAYKVYSILILIITGVSYTIISDVFRSINEKEEINTSRVNKLFYIYFLSGLILGSVTILFSEQIIFLLFGNDYLSSILILRSFGITILFWPIIMFIGLIFISYNEQAKYLFATLTNAVLSITCAYVFIGIYGFTGTQFIFPIISLLSLIVNLILLKNTFKKKNISITNIFSPYRFFRSLTLINIKK